MEPEQYEFMQKMLDEILSQISEQKTITNLEKNMIILTQSTNALVGKVKGLDEKVNGNGKLGILTRVDRVERTVKILVWPAVTFLVALIAILTTAVVRLIIEHPEIFR